MSNIMKFSSFNTVMPRTFKYQNNAQVTCADLEREPRAPPPEIQIHKFTY